MLRWDWRQISTDQTVEYNIPGATCSRFRQARSVPAQIAATVGGWLKEGWVGRTWEWLYWVAPTPQELGQQTECTLGRAKDKRSEIAIVAVAVATPSFDLSAPASSGCHSGTDGMVPDSYLLCKEAECNAMQCNARPRSLTLQCANIFSPLSPHSGDKEPQAPAGDKWNWCTAASLLLWAHKRRWGSGTTWLTCRAAFPHFDLPDYRHICSTWTLTKELDHRLWGTCLQMDS